MRRKQIIRIVLALVIVAALFYLARHMQQPAGAPAQAPAQTAETASQLTLLTDAPQTPAPAAQTAPASETPTAQEAPAEEAVTEDGSYTDVEDVAYYLHTYGHLPDNYITKAEAEDAGWNSYAGNLWDVAYGMSIGGDRFGNYEGQLPKGEKYYEADVNYDGGYRGGERIVYTDDGDVWYTSDHYESFERLY